MHRSVRRFVPIASLALLLSVTSAPSAGAATLVATVGPGHSISLRTLAGVPVRSVRAGSTWTISVRDRATDHNFRLAGPGFGRQTGIAMTGTRAWRVTFRRGTWSYLCQPHPYTMRGTVRAT